MINSLIIQEVIDQPLCIESNFKMAIAMAVVALFNNPVAVASDIRDIKIGQYTQAYAVESASRARQSENYKAGSIGIVSIEGPILENSDARYGIMGTLEAGQALKALDSNPNIIGNILVMESGGGAAYAVKPIRDIIINRTKPLVVFSKKILASAAYGIVASADSIVMYHDHGIVGSFGTMSSSSDAQPMFEKWGMKFDEWYATESKLKNKTYRDARNGNPEAYIKNVLDPLNGTYIGNIKADRGERISKKEAAIYQGETFSATRALELGMIDMIGSLDDAIGEVVRLHNAKQSGNSTNNNLNSDMKLPLLLALAGKTQVSKEELAAVNAELTQAGITGFGVYPESLVTEAATVTSERDQLQADKKDLTAKLETANGSVASLNTEITGLKAKIAANPAAAAAVVTTTDPSAEVSVAEQSAATIAGLKHNQGILNNPLFAK